MTYYAYYRPNHSSGERVIGWYDDSINSNMPDPQHLFEVSADQWLARMNNPSGWAVVQGQLAEWTPPPMPAPTPQQEAQSALQAGVELAFDHSSSLDGKYRCDLAAAASLQGVASFVALNNRFPGSTNSFRLVDYDGNTKIFVDTSVFVSFATALADYAADLNDIATGGQGSLPPPVLNIH